ncbi:hypothetical protein [Actinomadura coerulea]|uniref:hypothetical protein n=1 Tax=Actinomadura coerulea TaxID=46159 RepID=UPI00341866FE
MRPIRRTSTEHKIEIRTSPPRAFGSVSSYPAAFCEEAGLPDIPAGFVAHPCAAAVERRMDFS